MNEQIKKNLNQEKNSISNFNLIQSPKQDFSISYTLNKNFFNNNSQNIKDEPTQFFILENAKNSELKYSGIMKENENIKKFLFEMFNCFLNMVQIKKEVFLMYYQKAFGSEFQITDEINIDIEKLNLNLNSLKSLSLELDLQTFMDNFRINFIKFREFFIRIEELNLLNSHEQNLNNNTSIPPHIAEKYIENLMLSLENYKQINSFCIHLIQIISKTKLIDENNYIAEIISRLESLKEKNHFFKEFTNAEYLCIKNIKECINQNNNLIIGTSLNNINNQNNLIEISKMEQNENNNLDKFTQFNEKLLHDIQSYERFIENSHEFANKLN